MLSHDAMLFVFALVMVMWNALVMALTLGDALSTILPILVVSIAAPYVLARQINSNRRQERDENWAREDKVAKDLLDAQRATTVKITEQTTAITDQTVAIGEQTEAVVAASDVGAETLAQAKTIHKFVNAEATHALEKELSGLKRELILMQIVERQMIELGKDPDPAARTAMEALEANIMDQEAALAERAKQQAIVDAEGEGTSSDK